MLSAAAARVEDAQCYLDAPRERTPRARLEVAAVAALERDDGRDDRLRALLHLPDLLRL